ncbi:AI-2E family transporter [Parahaliea mediterranea]|uniref:AI-2E family transporter n=1 Tax=Parahaliea mediterranea TaxID=651086 RepID=A0A939DEL5_9GAMM|nr:AI-2E family transporter [Parahaliea mediterranea]MBN7796705.1 AI-2E family transporter [Parahaliea mediterranea]
MDTPQPDPSSPRQATEIIDVAVRLGLIALLAWFAFQVLAPFLSLMVWAIVLAIALYPVNEKLAGALGGSGRAATVLVLLLVLLAGVPTVLLGFSFVDHMLALYKGVADGSTALPPPRPGVADWPLVGHRVYAAWQAASDNLQAFAVQHQAQLRELSRAAAGALGNATTTLLAFLGAFIVAGIMMAYAHPGATSTRKIFIRICGPKIGPELHELSVATVRSVASGVVGVAFIQAVLLGVGFLIGDVPAAGVLAAIVLLLGIAQVPAALVVIPVVAWLWTSGDGSLLSNTLLSIYLVLAGLADNVLKPLLLGRGLAVPMPVILLGAIGGMIGSGVIGLFVGAVILAVAYQIFMAWVDGAAPAADHDAGAE